MIYNIVSFLCITKSSTSVSAFSNINSISFSELVYFFYSSWVSAYKLLGMNLLKEKDELTKYGVEIPSINQLVTWAKNYQDNIRMYLENSFRESGIDYTMDITYDQYKIWTSKNPQNIQVFYANKFLTCATNLNTLEEVEFVENNNSLNLK